MNIKVTNIYNNYALEDKGFKADWGNAFLIETPEEKILYDCGYKGDILLNNMKLVNTYPNDIDLLIFSHGHNDHTYGLKKLLFERTRNKKLPVIAHPDSLKKKRLRFPVNIILREREIGFPKLSENLKTKIEFQLLKEPAQIRPFLSTVGEVIKRPEKDGTSFFMTSKTTGKWKTDILLDDLSILLHTNKGLVMMSGCCHAGILNTCAKISTYIPNEKILAIMGGMHLLRFSKKKLNRIVRVLETEYDTPLLFLNHCTGDKAISYFKDHFGDQIFHDFYAGTSVTFEI